MQLGSSLTNSLPGASEHGSLHSTTPRALTLRIVLSPYYERGAERETAADEKLTSFLKFLEDRGSFVEIPVKLPRTPWKFRRNSRETSANTMEVSSKFPRNFREHHGSFVETPAKLPRHRGSFHGNFRDTVEVFMEVSATTWKFPWKFPRNHGSFHKDHGNFHKAIESSTKPWKLPWKLPRNHGNFRRNFREHHGSFVEIPAKPWKFPWKFRRNSRETSAKLQRRFRSGRKLSKKIKKFPKNLRLGLEFFWPAARGFIEGPCARPGAYARTSGLQSIPLMKCSLLSRGLKKGLRSAVCKAAWLSRPFFPIFVWEYRPACPRRETSS